MTRRTASIADRCLSLLEIIAIIPFGSAQDYAAFEGVHPDRVRERLRELRALDYIDVHAFGTPTLRSERRWWVTTHGYRALLAITATDAEHRAVRRHWSGRGVMARRVDVAAVITRVVARLARHITDSAGIRLLYFASGPLDCVVDLDGHRFVSVIHAGPSLRRRSVWARLKAFKGMPLASGYPLLVITPTILDRSVVLAQTSTLDLNAFASTEQAAVDEGITGWLAPNRPGWVSYRELATKRMMSRFFVSDQVPVRIADLELPFLEQRRTPVRNVRDSPALTLPPLGKRLLDILSHWPLLSRKAVTGILTITGSQLSDLLRSLRALDFITTHEADGVTSYSLSDVAISYISARDRCDVSAMLDRLSVSSRWHVPRTASSRMMIASYRGSLIRSILENCRHDSLVTEAIGNMVSALAKAPWRVIQFLPPRRARIALTPGSSIATLRAALSQWRVLSTKRGDITSQKNDIVVFPDAVLYIETDEATLRVALEVELTATTPRAWQDRLEGHVMHSMLRTPEQLVLFVVGSSTSEATALMAQTRWVQVYPKRSWPVATTTVGLLRQQSVTDPIWRVTGDSEVRHSLLDLPDLINRR